MSKKKRTAHRLPDASPQAEAPVEEEVLASDDPSLEELPMDPVEASIMRVIEARNADEAMPAEVPVVETTDELAVQSDGTAKWWQEKSAEPDSQEWTTVPPSEWATPVDGAPVEVSVTVNTDELVTKMYAALDHLLVVKDSAGYRRRIAIGSNDECIHGRPLKQMCYDCLQSWAGEHAS